MLTVSNSLLWGRHRIRFFSFITRLSQFIALAQIQASMGASLFSAYAHLAIVYSVMPFQPLNRNLNVVGLSSNRHYLICCHFAIMWLQLVVLLFMLAV